MAGRFPIYTDADVKGSVVAALIRRGWDVLRAIDRFPERTPDLIHFQAAAAENRVLVSSDRDMRLIGERWLREDRRFRGLVWWQPKLYDRMSPGDFLRAFEELADLDEPFSPHPIIHIKPRS